MVTITGNPQGPRKRRREPRDTDHMTQLSVKSVPSVVSVALLRARKLGGDPF